MTVVLLLTQLPRLLTRMVRVYSHAAICRAYLGMLLMRSAANFTLTKPQDHPPVTASSFSPCASVALTTDPQ